MVPRGPGIHGEDAILQWEDRLVRLLRARSREGVTLRNYWFLSIRIKVLTFFISRYSEEPPDEWTVVAHAPPPIEPVFLFTPRTEPYRPPRPSGTLRPILQRISEANRADKTVVTDRWI